MELYQLEAFVAVASQRSFSRAALQLYLSQPTISAHVKSLEKELSTPLFDRGKSDLNLTEAGVVLFRYAREMLDLRLTAIASIKQNADIGEEALSIAASSVPCQYLLPRAIAAFRKKHPSVSISLRQKNSRETCEDVFRYEFPLGIVGDRIAMPRLLFEPLLEDELVVAFPKNNTYSNLLKKETLRVADLTEHKLLMREPGSGTRSMFEKELVRAGHTLTMFETTFFDNQETIKQAMRQGIGLTVISRYVVEDYVEFGLLAIRTLEDLNLKRNFYLVSHAKRVLSPAAKAFLAHLKDFYSQEVVK